MLMQLETDFEKVRKYLKESPTFVYSVLDGIIPGFVYTEPCSETFLIGTASGIFYVIGNETNSDFNNSLLDLYNDRMNKKARFTLFSPSKKWDMVIDDLFKNNISRMPRFVFSFNERNYPNKMVKLPNEYSLKKIDQELILESDEFNNYYYEEYWGAVSKFLRDGVGYCILYNGKVVCECVSIFKSKHFAEIDIATKTEFRGKGLAKAAAQAFIDNCLANNITPRWDCSADNSASITLGNKLGFEIIREYSVFIKCK